MNVREAILKAADVINSRPELFDWGRCDLPSECGTPGCALGWISHFLGPEAQERDEDGFGTWKNGFMHNFTSDRTFYEEMEELAPGWTGSASICAKGLRVYADKYHPAPKVELGIPASVRAIFDAKELVA